MNKTSYFTSPMARKKKVECHFDPNSYRVISQQAEVIPDTRCYDNIGKPLRASNLLGQPADARPESEHRHNRPNPLNVNFVRQDVRLLNEPLCNVSTQSTASEQHKWWPHRSATEQLRQPPKTLDTTARSDYQFRGSGVMPCKRFPADNSPEAAARGAVPVNFLREPSNKQRIWKEGISYEHQYNCRLDPQYPVRSKRHGAFVWDRMAATQVNKLLHQNDLIADKHTSASPLSLPAVAM